MNKGVFSKRFALLMLLCSIITMANAHPVSETTARSVGAKFLHANAVLKTADPSALQRVSTYRTTNGTPAFYVFNGEKAFVIVSADDCATPVLGYSSEGRFMAEEIPVQMEEYLQGFVKQIQYGIENHLRGDELTVRQWELVKATGCVTEEKNPTVVAPLIQATWGQSGNYNDMCPSDSQGQALVGCVAVAMGQIMHYWGYPANGYGSHDYYPSGYPHQEVDFGAAVYDWANMPNSLDGATATQINAVATLLWHCGVAVNMIYGYNTSGAYSVDVPYAMLNYFSYSDDLYGAYQSYYDNATWIEMLKSSLDSEKPVYYSGQDTNGLGGHAFICDGYDASNFFHFNWGWYGMEQDTYFAINALNVANYQFNDSQYAIFNIHPDCTVGASYQISTTVNTAGGTVSGAGSYGCSAMCTVTASPADGYMFCSWTENGEMVSVDPSYSFIVTGNRNLEANFMQMEDDLCSIVFELQDSYGDGWNGNVLVVNYSDGCYESEQLTIESGSSASFTRTVVEGSHIILSWILGAWNGECSFTVSYKDSNQICSFSSPSSGFAYEFDVDCAGNAPVYYNITASAIPVEGGVVSGGGNFVSGQICTLQATANNGYSFTHWTKNGTLVSYNYIFSFTVTGDASYEAHFATASIGQVLAEYYPSASDVLSPYVKVSWDINDPEPPEPPTDFVTVILTHGDNWGDGSGYQMLLDADATAFGSIIPETGPLTAGGDASAEIYAAFEFKIPVNADGSCNTSNVVLNNSVSINIPAGVYDWCITNPTPGDRIWIASSQGNIGGRQDNYTFEAGKTYEFVLSMQGSNDAVDVVITEGSKGRREVLLSDDFESGNLGNWVLVDADNDGTNWQIATPVAYNIGNAHSGTYCASSWSWNNQAYNPDNYMISPAVLGASNISYYVATNVGYPDHYGVFVSTTGTNPSDFTLVFEEFVPVSKGTLSGVKAKDVAEGNRELSPWTLRSIDLPEGTKYVAFRHYNSYDCNYLFVDDVVITQTVNYYYAILRTDGNNNGPYTAANTVTLANEVINSPYIDYDWTNLASGTYKYGVSMSTVDGVVLDTLWSNQLEKIASYSITASANPSQGGSVSGAGLYTEGETCTLVATPSSSYDFVNWTRNGVMVSENASYSFTVNESAAYVANFQLKQYLVTVAAEPVDGGVVTGQNTYAHGTMCYLTATPNEGYRFVEWRRNGTYLSGNPSWSFVVTAPATCVAYFEALPPTYTITVAANPTEGGTVSGGGDFNAGAICTLQANANEGYVFDHWTKNGVTIPNSSSFSFNVTEDGTYIAFFNLKTYSVSVKADPEVGAVVTGSDVYQHGTTATVSVIPNSNYVFDHWIVNGTVLSETSMSYSFVVTQDYDIVASLNYIDDVNEDIDALGLFPNPVEKGSEVHVEMPDASGIVTIEIVDMLGRVVFSRQSDTSCTVSTAAMTLGVYTVALRTAEGCLVKKLLVR